MPTAVTRICCAKAQDRYVPGATMSFLDGSRPLASYLLNPWLSGIEKVISMCIHIKRICFAILCIDRYSVYRPLSTHAGAYASVLAPSFWYAVPRLPNAETIEWRPKCQANRSGVDELQRCGRHNAQDCVAQYQKSRPLKTRKRRNSYRKYYNPKAFETCGAFLYWYFRGESDNWVFRTKIRTRSTRMYSAHILTPFLPRT